MTVVQNVVRNAAGVPQARARVTIRLVAGDGATDAGYTSDGTVVGPYTAVSGSDGSWQVDLPANSTITPANTYYQVTERPVGGSAYVHGVVVPASGGPVELVDVLAEEPPTPDSPSASRTYVDTELSTHAAAAVSVHGLDSLGRIAPAATSRRGGLPQIMSLITGTEDETLSQVNCTITADTVDYKIGGRAWKFTMSGAVTANSVMSAPIPPAASGLLAFPPAQAVCMWLYCPDASKIDWAGVELSLNSGNTALWINTTLTAPAITLANGWNLIRLKTANGLEAVQASWGNINRIRVYVDTNAATSVTVGHVWLECPEKARMIFVLDRGYKTFVTSGALARLRAAGVPVTWAIDVEKLGANVGQTAEAVTEADIAGFAAEGDSISFHGFTANPTATMTSAEVRVDTIKCIKWLQARGYAGRMWRAAWVQDTAANSSAVQGLLLGQAQSSMPSVRLGTWPPINPHNMERWNFYGRTTTEVDTHFTLLQKTHGLTVTYNHGIHADGGNDATPAEFDYWMDKVEAALSAGWLEATTFEALWLESGGDFGTVGNAPVARYTDSTGAVASKLAL